MLSTMNRIEKANTEDYKKSSRLTYLNKILKIVMK